MAGDLDCVVCRHKKLADIDAAQTSGVDELTIAQKFGVTKVALRRHLNHKSIAAGNGPIVQHVANVIELRPCPICNHAKRVEIDVGIARGETWVNIGRVHGVPGSAVRIHAEKCLRDALRRSSDDAALKAAVKTAKERCAKLLATAETLIERAAADDEASYRDRAALITAAKGALELLGRFSGEIGPAAEILVIDSPRWKRIEAKIAEALVPYPEAAKAVAKALQDMEAA